MVNQLFMPLRPDNLKTAEEQKKWHGLIIRENVAECRIVQFFRLPEEIPESLLSLIKNRNSERQYIMKRNLVMGSIALLFVSGCFSVQAQAADNVLVGKWKVLSQTSNGQLEIVFEFKQEADKIVGSATAAQGGGVFSSVKLETSKFTADLVIGGQTYKLLASLEGEKMNGTWAQDGGDAKGTWTAAKEGAPAATASAGGISGEWNSIAVTPNGDMAATLALTQDGEKVSGEIRSEMGSLPIAAASFKGDKLQFDLDLGGNVYRIQAALKDGKFTGSWAPAGSTEGGPWSATRKSGTAPAAAASKAAAGSVLGTWNVIASTPDGEMRFVAEFKQANDVLTGSFTTPDGAIALQKPAFADGKLSFSLDYMGGTYRVEANLVDDKLTGKWADVGGGASGGLTAERKK